MKIYEMGWGMGNGKQFLLFITSYLMRNCFKGSLNSLESLEVNCAPLMESDAA